MVFATMSCGDDDPCAPHGHLHGDHCHCDAGYRAVGLSCEPQADAAAPPDAGASDAMTSDDATPDADVSLLPDAAACRAAGPCASDEECCDFCHDDHCH